MKTEIKLDVDIPTGEGQIKVMPHFEKMNILWQLDILKGWIWDLQELYNNKVDVWENEVKTLQEEVDGRNKTTLI